MLPVKQYFEVVEYKFSKNGYPSPAEEMKLNMIISAPKYYLASWLFGMSRRLLSMLFGYFFTYGGNHIIQKPE